MRRMWLWLIVLITVTVGIVLLPQRFAEDASVNFSIVTTFHPVTALVKPITGSSAAVVQLIPSGQPVHDYHPTPSDISKLQNADVLILNGADVEHEWLEPLLESAGRTDLTILDLAQALESAGVELLEGESDAHASDFRDPTSDIRTDPHIWLSPRNAIVMAESIRDELVRLDPTQAAQYQAHATTLLAELRALDQEIEQSVAGFPQKKFIAFHNAFSYFARDYGLTQVASLQLTPGEAPTPGQLSQIRSLVREGQLNALFREPQFSSDVIDQLAKDLNVEVLVLDPLETSSDSESYATGMRRNLDQLAKALR